MKLDKACALFFGTKIDSKLREGLALSKPGDKKYFDGSSEEFLRIMELGEDKDKERITSDFGILPRRAQRAHPRIRREDLRAARRRRDRASHRRRTGR